MKLLVNDLSIKEQFHDVPTFKTAIHRLMDMKNLAQQHGRNLYCHHNLAQLQITNNMKMLQIIQHLEHSEKMALMQWLTQNGPFWDDERHHSPDNYFECHSEIVTDTAIGEAAYRCFYGADYRLVSLAFSPWNSSPLSVFWQHQTIASQKITLENYFSKEQLEAILESAPRPIESWQQLAESSPTRFPHLSFSTTAFDPLHGIPLNQTVVDGILRLLKVLEQLQCNTDKKGGLTPKGIYLLQQHFTGDKAWFSDSSDSEKNCFKLEMTFKDPETGERTLFCPWHGKIKTPQIRIHFSWSSGAKPFHVATIGPKITKR